MNEPWNCIPYRILRMTLYSQFWTCWRFSIDLRLIVDSKYVLKFIPNSLIRSNSPTTSDLQAQFFLLYGIFKCLLFRSNTWRLQPCFNLPCVPCDRTNATNSGSSQWQRIRYMEHPMTTHVHAFMFIVHEQNVEWLHWKKCIVFIGSNRYYQCSYWKTDEASYAVSNNKYLNQLFTIIV